MNYVRESDAAKLAMSFNSFAFTTQLSEEMAEKLKNVAITGSQADTISQGRELLYAYKDILDDEGLVLLGQLAAYAVDNAWGADNAEGRCQKILEGARRDLGEPGNWLDEDDDPDPKSHLRHDGISWKIPNSSNTPAPIPPVPIVPPLDGE